MGSNNKIKISGRSLIIGATVVAATLLFLKLLADSQSRVEF